MTTAALRLNAHGSAPALIEAELRRSAAPLSATDLSALTSVGIVRTREVLADLCKSGKAEKAGCRDRMRIFVHSANASGSDQTRQQGGEFSTPCHPYIADPSSHYDGRELRPYEGRPGAMRAFELPSLSNGRRTERRAPTSIGTRHFVSQETGQRT